FLYLNRDGVWPDFHRELLEAAPDGTLTPTSLPGPNGPLPNGLAAGPPVDAGVGAGPTQLRQPRGLLDHRGLSRLLIADGGNARITLFDLTSRQVTGF